LFLDGHAPGPGLDRYLAAFEDLISGHGRLSFDYRSRDPAPPDLKSGGISRVVTLMRALLVHSRCFNANGKGSGPAGKRSPDTKSPSRRGREGLLGSPMSEDLRRSVPPARARPSSARPDGPAG